MVIRKYIRNYCIKIAEKEKLNLWSIQFRKSLPDGIWGRNCDGSPNNSNSIIFCEDILNIKTFEKKEQYSVWLIILHEITHLKVMGHNTEFYKYLKQLSQKYPAKEFYEKLLEELK